MSELQGLQKLKHSLPGSSWSDNPDLIAPHLVEWRDRWLGHSPLLLLPKNTQEVSTAVKICAEYGIAITPQGGNTGLVGGQIPQGEVLLSTQRMHSVRANDAYTMTVDAGCILQTIQSIASDNDRLFPLSLASEGSATIGGLCSTNAGGVHVQRYGSMRDLVSGIEVVLADGSVLNTMSLLKKDNTGYNMTPLFLGAEGTLGVITAAQLKLFPKPLSTETFFIAVNSLTKAVKFFHRCKSEFPNELSLVELMSHSALEFVTTHIPGHRSPFKEAYPWYVLLQFDFQTSEGDPERVNSVLDHALQSNLIIDGTQARSGKQATQLLNLREHISEAQKPEGGSIKHDVSVPVDDIPKFIEQATKAVQLLVPGCRPIPFGHIGDGNIHFNVSQPIDMDQAEYLKHWESMNKIVHDIVNEFGGSISAEHGIGILKKKELAYRADETKYKTMKQIKLALDPHNIMNPRVLLS